LAKLTDIIDAIRSHRVRITDHADEQAASDGLPIEDIFFTALHGETIEDYPGDRPYPSCLIFGKTSAGLAVHSVWAYNPNSGWAVLITVYRPDPQRWTDWKERRKP
jgi:hypothetical protein